MQAVPPASYAYFCFVQPDLTVSSSPDKLSRIAEGSRAAPQCAFSYFSLLSSTMMSTLEQKVICGTTSQTSAL